MTVPLISVVVPAHNAKATLGLALSSLAQQTWTSWEAIVVDDGSTDDCADIAHAMRDARIQVHRQESTGAAGARNTGLGLAKGDFVAFLDADDFLFPTYLEQNLRLLTEGPRRSIVTNNAHFLHPDGLRRGSLRHTLGIPSDLTAQQDAILRSNFASIMSMFPHGLLDDVPGFDVELDRAEDWDFWIRASFKGWLFLHQSRPLALINRTQESLTSATDRVADAEAAILRKTLETQALSERQASRIKNRLTLGEPSKLRAESETLVGQGNYQRAALLHWQATRMTTSSPRPLMRAAAFCVAPGLVGPLLRRRRS